MFNEAMNSWEKPAMVRPGQQLSSAFPAAGVEMGERQWKKFCTSLCKKLKLIELLGQFALFFFRIPPGARRRRTSMLSSLSAGTLSL